MIGAIIGDIAGSRFERHNNKTKSFEMFDKRCRPTDDSIMSFAVARAILDSEADMESLSKNAVIWMQGLGRIYRNAGYGGSFAKWIMSADPEPYNSYGNGSAMRVSPCGYAAGSIEQAKELSALVTKVTHDHPEGMKGAEAIAVAVYLARTGADKDHIKRYIEEHYYKIDFTIDEIRETYEFDVSCQGSVPVAIEAFLESADFEDAIRTAISVGGDSDTIAAMTGSVAEAYYGVPEKIIYDVIEYLDSREMEILYYFEKKYPSKAIAESGSAAISVFDVLNEAIDKIIPEGAEIRIDEEYTDGSVSARVDADVLVPDFSSFDKSNEGIIDSFSTAGEGVAKAARKAGKGLISVIKINADNADESKKSGEVYFDSWYEIIPGDSEDTEDIIYAVERLQKDGYRAGVTVYSGTMHGYVFINDKLVGAAQEYMKMPAGNTLDLKKLDKRTSEIVKKHLK